MSQEPVIGIDLGTTFSVVATIDEHEKPIILPNSKGQTTTPSVIAFTPGGIKIGAEAKSIQANGDVNVASFFKRRMGDTGYVLEFFGTEYNSQSLSALLLKKLKEDAELALKQKVSQAVITVPAYFNDRQRTATQKAGKEAGLNVLSIINEPVAAAIAYGMGQVQGNQTLLVYDLGGGTFDVTIVKVTDNAISDVGTEGNHQLGGKDWDERIIKYVAAQFKEEYDADPLNDIETVNELVVQCEEAKRTLSELSNVNIMVFFDGNKGKYNLTREKFEELTSDIVEQTITLCNHVVDEAIKNEKITSLHDIDGVLLVGGSTRMPMIEKAVETFLGKKPIYGVNVDEAVACGAAMYAQKKLSTPQAQIEGKSTPAQLLGRKKKLEEIEIAQTTSHSLGMIAENHDRSKYVNAIILKRGTTIPCYDVRPLSFRTTSKKANECDVYLLQGESDSPSDCDILDKYVFSDIKHEKDGKAVLDITYRYDENSIVAISGKQRSTGKELKCRCEPVPQDMSWIHRSPREVSGTTEYEHITVIIAVDTSASMSGTPFTLAKEAAKKFVREMDLSRCSIGLIETPDGGCAQLVLQPTQNGKELNNANQMLSEQWHSERLFEIAKTSLSKRGGKKYLIVLTDGQWGTTSQMINEAKECQKLGIDIAAVGFGSINSSFLQAIANWDMIVSSPERFAESFSTIAQVLTEGGGERGKLVSK